MAPVKSPPDRRSVHLPSGIRAQQRAAKATSKPATKSASTTPSVSLRQVGKTYPDGSQALIDVSLELRKGDFLFITGPSGAGKSTLLKLLYGQEKFDSGSLTVGGFNLANLRGNQLALLRRRIGIIFQDYKLIPRRTVAENVAFVLWAQGYNRKEISRRLPPTLKMVGLQHKADCFPSQLSGGEQQRVSIARAVVGMPPLLLADEPTGNLDADNSRQVIRILKKLNSIGITVIVTTHDEHLVRTSNFPVVQLRDGRLYQVRS
ncbi:cell division ATP-binding protein FtsE [Romeria aff. gracilis LEGE 07310]|uniref:Cell division ATP-binding protein FtsE n=1 Tax=Vasconcelosia minhoensis LEGE 07310 TaxID=915328 RepID=A0A8J7DBK5_9CYAN|nr:cell division ATP-binding protein FtsE [Romeria gracilis]MBE9077857.1 cell division ATP-binding protein FtsE [Romeria aff. gracilis LEGE 07310]